MLHNRQEGELSRVILFEQDRAVATGISNWEKKSCMLYGGTVILILACVSHHICN